MRDAATVLSIIRERSERGLPLEDAYGMLYNPTLYLYAYGRISSNHGAMTAGVTDETVDGMTLAKIHAIIALIRREAYRWTPVRRTQIPKKNGKTRPLGIPTWSDKLLQEAMRLILEAHYEPRLSTHSHGFRPGRGCHTALREVTHWTATKWFVEGDIKGCFDNIDHEVLLSILAETIHDNRFLRLIRHMLQAGYVENWVYGKTMSGTPQGGVISPILANVYLDKLDQYVETELKPAYTRGKGRRVSRPYNALREQAKRARQCGQLDKARQLRKGSPRLPSRDPNDPNFRRLWYVRYADDFLIGFIGPKEEAREIKQKLKDMLQGTLHLEMSAEKTLITHATTDMARFLGYQVTVQQRWDYITKGRRSANGRIALRLPADVVIDYARQYMIGGRPKRNHLLEHESDFTIVRQYGSIFRGLYNYYALATNVSWLNRVQWAMQQSLLHTLADKHKTSVLRIIKRYRAVVEHEDGARRGLAVRIEREGKAPLVASFGGEPITRKPMATLSDIKPYLGPRIKRNERINRLLHETCELCGSREPVQGHHIRKLADLERYGKRPPAWAFLMSARHRKTLFVCRSCHEAIHYGHINIERIAE